MIGDDILRELSVERSRWDDENYHCMIFTKGNYFKEVLEYVDTWWSIEKFSNSKIHLYKGGVIQLVDVTDRNYHQLLMTCCGKSLTTAIVQVGSEYEGFNYWHETPHTFFPNYVMGRLRREAVCSPRMVII